MEEASEQHRKQANYQGTTFPDELFQALLARLKSFLGAGRPTSCCRLLPSSRRGKRSDVPVLQFPVPSQAHYHVNHY